jgi:putative membrane protein
MFKKNITTLIQGFALGIAEIIPGISGSTVALLLGIYDDFIDLLYQGTQLLKSVVFFCIGKASVADVKKAWFDIRWRFGVMLGIGMVSAVFGLSSFILYLLLNTPHFLFAFLIGLTLPTMAIVYGQITKPTFKHVVIGALTAALFLVVFILGEGGGAVTNPHPLHLFVGGMVAVSAMVLPGVSGSFMLLILGLYNFAVGLIASVSTGLTTSEITSLLILIAGMATGLLTTVRLLKWAFEKMRNELMSFILGLLAASWYVLWPFVQVTSIEKGEPVLGKVSISAFDIPTIALLVIIAGATAGFVYGIHTWADNKDKHSPKTDSGFDRL